MKYVRKILSLLLSLWLLLTIIFFLQRLLPGNPAELILGVDASEESKRIWLQQHGMDLSLITQYQNYFLGLLKGNLGITYFDGTEITPLLLKRLGVSMQLGFFAYIVALLGAMLALYFSERNQFLKSIIKNAAFVSASLPGSILGPILIWLFAVKFQVFPVGGMQGSISLILPMITLAVPLMGNQFRYLESTIKDISLKEFIRVARAKGVSEHKLFMTHKLTLLFYAALPIFSLQLGALLTGVVITEVVFSYPGLGTLTLQSVLMREYSLASACVLVTATMYIIINTLTDLFLSMKDPRRYG